MNYIDPVNINQNYQNNGLYTPIIEQERWTPITEKSVPNIKEGYLISSYGRVYSTLSNVFLIPTLSCWGYLRVSVATKLGYKHPFKLSIHRVVLIEFSNPLPPNYENLQANHVDAIKTNNFIWNLEWSTASENSLYAYRDGTRIIDGATNGQGTIQAANRRFNYKSDTINSIPQDVKQDVINMLLRGKNYLTIHRRTGVSMQDITKIKFELFNIPVGRMVVGNNRYGEFRLTYTDEQIHAICQYFQDHKYDHYDSTSELYRECLYELFGIEYDETLSNAMKRYYKRIYRHDITDLYDY